MKNVFPVILLLFVCLFGSCKKIEFADELARSKDVYIAFKASTGNSYAYVVRTDSWIGVTTLTTITVENGKVVKRAYVLKERVDTINELVVKDQWTEDASSLGSHEAGADIQTLDDVYDRARKDWLKKRDDANTYFEAKNNGMISTAGYVNKNCADDCFVGIEISSIEKL
ncbi:hypothetical protein [Chitinophaga sp.]|uniref:hypothetical protein n=1 Tax=Chitinophaga sp. TaxID=1869181 RepID=UPI0031DC84C3